MSFFVIFVGMGVLWIYNSWRHGTELKRDMERRNAERIAYAQKTGTKAYIATKW